MPNRRDFLMTVGGATAGMLMMNRLAHAQARREVMVNGRDATVVDIHAHASIQEVENVIRGTNVERNIGGPRILGPDRLAWMDDWGVDISVISANQYWWYAADENVSARIIRVQDEGFAEWCQRYPDRFVFLTSVALQHPELAAEQLEYAVNELGARGASCGGHVNGEVPTSTRFDPFWAMAQELDVPVFVHPGGADNVLQENALEGRGDLGNIIGNPLETTVFLTRMIFEGTLDRFPRLKLVGAHGGGYLPSYMMRTEVACDVRGDANCANTRPPSYYLRNQIWADSMVFSEEGLRHLVNEMGASQIVYGSDMPFDWPDTIDIIADSPSLSDPEKLAILGGNLIDMLRIET